MTTSELLHYFNSMYSRRHFLKLTGLLGLVPVALKAQKNDDNLIAKDVVYGTERIAVAQGATDETSTTISILVHKKTSPTVKVFDPLGQELISQVQRMDFNLEGDFDILQVFVDQLALGKSYKLEITDAAYVLPQVRYFKSLDLSNKNARIALLSCSCHREAGPKTLMFQKLFNQNPDVIFFNGDLVYGNSSLDTYLNRPAKPKDAYKVYVKSLMEFELYNRSDLIPIFSTWDDHDLAYNNSDVNHPYKFIYYKVFRGFFPTDDRVKAITQGPGISFAMEAFGFHVIFLDTRFFKDKKNGQFLGDEQMIWLMEELPKNSLPKLFVLSQQLFYYSFIAESFERHAPMEFKHFMSFCERQSAPALFITGDVHYSQIQEIDKSWLGYPSYELTSSAIFSSSARGFGERDASEGQLAYYGYANFMMLDQIKTDAKSIEISINCVSETSDTQFSKTLTITK